MAQPRRLDLLLAFAAALLSSWVLAAESAPPPQLQLIFVDSQGKSSSLNWPGKTMWVWSEGAAPELWARTEVDIPTGYSVEGLESSEQMRVRESGKRLVVETHSSLATARMKVRGPQGSGPESQEIDFGVALSTRQPVTLSHPSCEALGLHLVPMGAMKGPETLIYSGISCIANGTGAKIAISRPAGTQLKSTGSALENDALSVSIPEKAGVVAGFRVSSPRTGAEQEFSIVYSRPSRWSGFAGLGGSYVTFNQQQSTASISVSQQSLTLKAGLSYALIPKKFDLGLSGFTNLLNFSQNASVAGLSARFTGLNFRAGYLLPFQSSVSYSVFGGYYVWMMSLSDPSYGLLTLSGPQAGIQLARTNRGLRSYMLYLKYGALGSPSGMNLANCELGLGGNLQINSGEARWPLLLSLDLSNFSYATSDGTTLSSRSYSLGLGTRF